jgi:hypothetical protein
MIDDTYSPGARHRLAKLGYAITDDAEGCHITRGDTLIMTIANGAWLEQIEQRLTEAVALPKQEEFRF